MTEGTKGKRRGFWLSAASSLVSPVHVRSLTGVRSGLCPIRRTQLISSSQIFGRL